MMVKLVKSGAIELPCFSLSATALFIFKPEHNSRQFVAVYLQFKYIGLSTAIQDCS